MLPSRNTIPQSAIGIDKNEQSDYLTCIQRKNRRSRLEGSKKVVQSLARKILLRVFSDVGVNTHLNTAT